MEYIKFVEENKADVSDAIKPILDVGRFFFEAGEQSRQAEIEEITETLKTSADSEIYLFEELQKVKKERDELQKRIDEAVKELELIHFYKTQNSNNAIKILKGNKND